jgi:hypothetical protein
MLKLRNERLNHAELAFDGDAQTDAGHVGGAEIVLLRIENHAINDGNIGEFDLGRQGGFQPDRNDQGGIGGANLSGESFALRHIAVEIIDRQCGRLIEPGSKSRHSLVIRDDVGRFENGDFIGGERRGRGKRKNREKKGDRPRLQGTDVSAHQAESLSGARVASQSDLSESQVEATV